MQILPLNINLILACVLTASAWASESEQLINLPPSENELRYSLQTKVELHWPAVHGEAQVCLWGDDKFAPVTVTIDDNNAPDIPFWQDMSKIYGWKFTWFVIVHPFMWNILEDKPGSNHTYFGTAESFEVLYEQGHEIELHGSCKAMNNLGEADYRFYVEQSIQHLQTEIGNKITAFSYPCGATQHKDTSYRDILAERMVGARGTSGGANSLFTIDYMNTKSMGDGQSQNFWDKMEKRQANLKYSSYRGWAVLLFHKASKKEVRELFDRLQANEDKFWIQPFTVVARYAQERESSQLVVTRADADRIDFTLTDSMDDERYNVPLTIKLRTDGWNKVKAVQDGKLIPARIVNHDDATYVLVDAVPDRGAVSVLQQWGIATKLLRWFNKLKKWIVTTYSCFLA
jgi:peptidoglycan/xylan/chitin deacetylase (PgdA/CDA1 family)